MRAAGGIVVAASASLCERAARKWVDRCAATSLACTCAAAAAAAAILAARYDVNRDGADCGSATVLLPDERVRGAPKFDEPTHARARAPGLRAR